MDINDVLFKDLERIACRYLDDGDIDVFEWEVAKLAFIMTTHSVANEGQLKTIDRLTTKTKLSMMKNILEEIQAKEKEGAQ